MTTMACLISNQHVPNLLTVHECKPDHLLLLVTEGMEGKERLFLNALKAGGLDYDMNHDIIAIEDEVSVDFVYHALQKAYDADPHGWSINLTGGTKPMSMGAFTFARDYTIRTLYISEQNQREAIDLLGGPTLTLHHHVSTVEFLAGYGFQIINAQNLETNAADARNMVKIAAFLTFHHENSNLQNFLGALQSMKENIRKISSRKFDREGLQLVKDDNLYLPGGIRSGIAEAFQLKEAGGSLEGRLDKHAVEFLTGKWLEVFIFGLLDSCSGTSLWDLQHGMSIGGRGVGENNELDVSFMRDQSFCIVECKTGRQGHDPGAMDTFYKIEAIKAGLKALRVNTFLATTSSNVIDKNTGQLLTSIKNRCALYQCSIIHRSMLREMAELYIKKDSALQSTITSAFHLRL